MSGHQVVSHEAWLEARKAFLAKEKAFTRERDALSTARRALPWERVEKPYRFDTAEGEKTLAGLFGGRSQLVMYHFMFGADWEDPCKSCSFWADNFNGITEHLRHRDVTMLAVSTAPLPRLEAMKRRMGWTFPWVSSGRCDFNHDFHVTFSREELDAGEVAYNYGPRKLKGTEMPGISVFYRDPDGAVFHTYSCYARGLDMMNGAYNYLDLTPKGRDEDGLSFPMAWVRLHDKYEATP